MSKPYTVEVTSEQLHDILNCPGHDHRGHSLTVLAKPDNAAATALDQARRDLAKAQTAYEEAAAKYEPYRGMPGGTTSAEVQLASNMLNAYTKVEQLTGRVAILEAKQ